MQNIICEFLSIVKKRVSWNKRGEKTLGGTRKADQRACEPQVHAGNLREASMLRGLFGNMFYGETKIAFAQFE